MNFIQFSSSPSLYLSLRNIPAQLFACVCVNLTFLHRTLILKNFVFLPLTVGNSNWVKTAQNYCRLAPMAIMFAANSLFLVRLSTHREQNWSENIWWTEGASAPTHRAHNVGRNVTLNWWVGTSNSVWLMVSRFFYRLPSSSPLTTMGHRMNVFIFSAYLFEHPLARSRSYANLHVRGHTHTHARTQRIASERALFSYNGRALLKYGVYRHFNNMQPMPSAMATGGTQSMCEKRKTNNKLYRLTVCLTCCRGSDEYNAIVLDVDVCLYVIGQSESMRLTNVNWNLFLFPFFPVLLSALVPSNEL